MASRGRTRAKELPLLSDFSGAGAGGALHPGSAHEAAGNEANVVDVGEYQRHKLRHHFLHQLINFFV
jgi:hypothetical protein